MDDKWLWRHYLKFNKKWFDGFLPAKRSEILVQFGQMPHDSDGYWEAWPTEDGGWQYSITVNSALLRADRRKAVLLELLHEMVHQEREMKGFCGHIKHDEWFKKQLRYLMLRGAFDDLL